VAPYNGDVIKLLDAARLPVSKSIFDVCATHFTAFDTEPKGQGLLGLAPELTAPVTGADDKLVRLWANRREGRLCPSIDAADESEMLRCMRPLTRHGLASMD